MERTFTDLKAMQDYVESPRGPFRVEKKQGEVRFELQYLPTDLVMKSSYEGLEDKLQRLSKEDSIPAADKELKIRQWLEGIETQKSQYGQNIYLKLVIGFSNNDRDLIYSHTNSYSNWLQKLLFSMGDYIEMRAGNDEIPLVHYTMERTYGMTKSRTFLLVFPAVFEKEEVMEADEVTLKLSEFGLGTGPVYFNFDLPLPKPEYKPDLSI